MAYFKFIGRIAAIKDNEKFHPISRNDYSSGWTNTTVNFNCISDMNRIGVRIQGGKWIDDSKNAIYTFSKTITNNDGSVIKGKKIQFPWASRFEKSEIDKVAGFRKFVFCDKEFLSEYDFAEYVVEFLGSEYDKDTLYDIRGNYDIQYNSDKNQFYPTYHVNRIYLANEDAESKTELHMDFYFNETSWNEDSYDESGKIFVNGWTSYYDNSVKATGFMPITIVIKQDNKGAVKLLRNRFSCDDDEIKQIGLILTVINGAEEREITLEDLSDDIREEIECGLRSFETVKKELGGKMAGNTVREFRFAEISGKGVQDTTYTREDMHEARAKQDEESIDIFADEDEDL